MILQGNRSLQTARRGVTLCGRSAGAYFSAGIDQCRQLSVHCLGDTNTMALSQLHDFTNLHEQLYPPRVLIHSCSHPWSGEWHSSYLGIQIFARAPFKSAVNSLFHEAGGEASLLDGAVGDKLDPETVRRRLDVFWHLVATEGSNQISP